MDQIFGNYVKSTLFQEYPGAAGGVQVRAAWTVTPRRVQGSSVAGSFRMLQAGRGNQVAARSL